MKTSLGRRMAAFLSASTRAGSLTIVVSTSLLAASVLSSSEGSAATVPSGFTDALVASGLTWPTGLAVANDGRIFATEQSGALKVIKNGALLPTPFIKLTVRGAGGAANEEGLVGIALDPSFTTNNFLYVYYTVPPSGTIASHNRVSRFTANGDVAVPGSEKILLDVPGPSSGSHNGGAIHFGADGKLYIGVGDHTTGRNSQLMTTIKGKLLRISGDGTIPSDNPFFTTATGQNRAIWALGLRNPYRFGVQPGTGKILINDVGNGAFEEINEGVAGGNYGWNLTEGPTNDPRFRSPLFAYPHSAPSPTVDGCAIVGGAFYNPTTVMFPSFYVGKYFFADYCKGWMRVLDPATGAASDFATGVVQPVDLQVGNDGALYYLDRFAGSVRRITFAASNTAPVITSHPSSVTVAVGQPASFSVSAEGTQPLTFQWQRDHADIAGATATTYTLPSAALSDSGASFQAIVGNLIDTATSNKATLTVISNGVPTGTITEPAAGSTYSAGDTIDYVGTGTDPEDGTLPPSAFTWRVDFHHDTHFHPFVSDTSGESGSFIIPTLGETSANVWYRIHLTVRNSSGLTNSSFLDVLPNTVDLAFETSPPGLQVRLDGPPLATPASIESVVGLQQTIGVVSPQTLNNQTYVFSSWAHGGTATQDIQTPTVDTTYIANYVPSGGGTFSDAFDRPDSPDVGTDWLEVSEGLSISGTELRSAPTKNLFQIAIVPTFSSAAQTVAASFATVNGNSLPRFGVALRYQDPQNYYLVSRRSGGTSVLQISKVVNGHETVLATKSVPNPVSNTFFRLEGQANGATLTLRVDGVQMLSVVDSTFSAGSVGIGLGSMSTTIGQIHRADDFAASGM
jgi:glucose/arabinose dehydrogenase